MPRRAVESRGSAGAPWFDIVSHGRRGPGKAIQFSRSQLNKIALTVRRAPEVMVKVSGGGRTTGAVAAHLQYIGRHGRLNIETDDGAQLAGRNSINIIKDEWMLGADRPGHGLEGYGARATGPRKQVHNVVLSMPVKTAPDKLLAAAKAFAREQFAFKNRYAMVLHTDQKHPHVHLVVKAIGLDGRPLHIDKATLRLWRENFAGQLRAVGISANATARATRGRQSRKMSNGLFRLLKRQPWRQSTSFQARALAGSTPSGAKWQPYRAGESRRSVDAIAAWEIVRANLESAGENALAAEVRAFVAALKGKRAGTTMGRDRGL